VLLSALWFSIGKSRNLSFLSTLLLIPFGSLCPSKSSHSPTLTLKKGHVQRLLPPGLDPESKAISFCFQPFFQMGQKGIDSYHSSFRPLPLRGQRSRPKYITTEKCPTRESDSYLRPPLGFALPPLSESPSSIKAVQQ